MEKALVESRPEALAVRGIRPCAERRVFQALKHLPENPSNI
jgi:hypothetical protein